MDNKNTTNGYFGIPGERMEELKRITKEMMNSNISRVNSNLVKLDAIELLTSLENRSDMTTGEKILCSFQMGMNAQRLLNKEKPKI